MSISQAQIREAFARLRREGQRHRDIAAQLSVSEGELIAAHVGAVDEASPPILRATRLRADWPALIASLEPLGEVMALTRNASCVHEKIGVYRRASHNGPVGLVLDSAIDLRVFYAQWAHGFAVSESGERDTQLSLQFFDAQGVAVHKVIMKPQSDAQAYAALVTAFLHEDQSLGLQAQATAARVSETPDEQVNVAAFRQDWRALRDTHEFFGLLKQHKVSRTQALRLAEPAFAQQVDVSSAQQILSQAAQDGVSIMVFVGNPGMIQIHTGPVRRVAMMGPWINVLDADFNLHLREDHIATAWVVRKPTTDGLVTSLELFDAEGEVIAMFFGERKPGKPELCEWRALVDNLLKEPQPCAA